MEEKQNREVLVVPRSLFEGLRWFIPWDVVESQLSEISGNATWANREIAERSSSTVQIIPCGLLQNPSGEYCVQRRVKFTRSDLRSKISLTFGGHVDRPENSDDEDFLQLLLSTLYRELEEELGIRADNVNNIENIGVIVDPSSLLASRHVAFLFRVYIDSSIVTLADEEFSIRSKYIKDSFLKVKEITALRFELDPWSKIVFEEHLDPAYRPDGRQISLLN